MGGLGVTMLCLGDAFCTSALIELLCPPLPRPPRCGCPGPGCQVALTANVTKLPKETLEFLSNPELFNADITPPGAQRGGQGKQGKGGAGRSKIINRSHLPFITHLVSLAFNHTYGHTCRSSHLRSHLTLISPTLKLVVITPWVTPAVPLTAHSGPLPPVPLLPLLPRP